MEKQKTYTGRDIEFQRKEWRAQRIGWVVMALIVIGAMVGVLGNSGPVARASRTAGDGSFEVHYYRLERHHGPGELSVEVAPEAVQDGEVRLWLDRDFVVRAEIQRVVPEPDRVAIEPDRVIYVFAAGEQPGPLTIAFSYEHDGYWLEQGRLGLVDGETVEFSLFLFP